MAASYQYKSLWYTTVDEKSISFKVRACSDVYISLARYIGITDYDNYEIMISNSKVAIRDGVGGSSLVEKQVTGLLHCTQSNWFWVNWSKGISMGSGPYVNDQILLSLDQLPRSFQIYSAGFTTGAGNDGDWEFTSVPGNFNPLVFSLRSQNVAKGGLST